MKEAGRRALILPGSRLTIAFALLVAVMLWDSLGLSRASAWIPQAILLNTLLLLLWQLAAELITGQLETPAGDGHAVRVIAAAAWIGSLLLSTWLLGAAPGSALFCFAWLRWRARERWLTSFAFAAGLGLSLWLLFAVLLRANLYSGVLVRLFS